MSDIVERLRLGVTELVSGAYGYGETELAMRKAADEIERLREENLKLMKWLRLWRSWAVEARGEVLQPDGSWSEVEADG